MKSRHSIRNKSLDSYKPVRALLCTLIDKDLLSERLQKNREIKMFMKLYESNGKNCAYLLALCKAIHSTNNELYQKLLTVKLENGK